MLERIRGRITAVKTGDRKAGERRGALVVQVVNRVHRARVAKQIAAAQTGMEIDRKECRMPVVRMNDVGTDAEALASGDDSATEDDIPLHSIERAAGRRVDLIAIEVV